VIAGHCRDQIGRRFDAAFVHHRRGPGDGVGLGDAAAGGSELVVVKHVSENGGPADAGDGFDERRRRVGGGIAALLTTQVAVPVEDRYHVALVVR
jgi:hypothetical protein